MRSDIKPNDKVLISVKDGHLPDEPYFSSVADIIDKQTMLLHTPVSKGSFIRLSVNEKYIFILYTKCGLFKAEGKIISHFLENSAELMKVKIFDWQLIQRRHFYRLDIKLDFTFTRNADITEDVQKDVPVYEGSIKNLSGGGICFDSDAVLRPGEHILCTLVFKNPELMVEGKVLDAGPLENKNGIYIYRAEFVNMEDTIREQIVQYVYCIQIEMIKKNKIEFHKSAK